MIEELLQELKRLQKAEELLKQVWLEYGPYGNGKIEEKTWWAVSDHFNFDDSE